MGNRAKDLNKPSLLEKQEKTVKVYFGVFFEGTGNHKDSAEKGRQARTEDTDTSKWKKPFNVAKSNVTMLREIYDIHKETYIDTVYIEGVGVSDTGTDTSTYELVTGMGDYGVHKKVEKAITLIKTQINQKNIPAGSKITLHIDVFGFSRGAAAARFFVGKFKGEKSGISDSLSNNSTLNDIIFDFVGLYDTVSSYGLSATHKKIAVAGGTVVGGVVSGGVATSIPSYKNNVKDLQLDAVQYAKKVFQICAADEFREQFALTNIDSAKTNGLQIFLPGCHTDIGGGYLSGRDDTLQEGYLKDEDKVILKDVEPIWAARPDNYDMGYELGSFIAYGWIRTTIGDNYTFEKNTFSKKGTLTFSNNMKGKKGYYPYLTYELMIGYACKNHARGSIFREIESTNKTPVQLEFIKNEAFNCTSIYICRDKFHDKYKELTKDWLHFSSKNSLIDEFAPRIVNKILKREIING